MTLCPAWRIFGDINVGLAQTCFIKLADFAVGLPNHRLGPEMASPL
jgi:hypothetical protein